MGTVLVVDDHPDLCNAITRIVEIIGANAAGVTSGRAALEYVRSQAVSLIILDYMMPDLDGLEVLRTIRADERLRQIPVVLCTALNDDAVKQEAVKLGAQEFLLKSAITIEKLWPVVRRYVPTK